MNKTENRPNGQQPIQDDSLELLNVDTEILDKLPLNLIRQITTLREVRDYLREYAKSVHYKKTAIHNMLNDAEEQLNELVYRINSVVNAAIENELYFTDSETGKECA